MLKKILRMLCTLIGLIVGGILGNLFIRFDFIKNLFKINSNNINAGLISYYVVVVLLFGLIFFLVYPLINKQTSKLVENVEFSMGKVSVNELILGTTGALIGLVISVLVISIFPRLNLIGTIIAVIVAISMAVLGADIAIRRKEEFTSFIQNISLKRTSSTKDKKSKNQSGDPKVLDTSVIIDGRIFDICQTGFIEGSLIIPTFVLEELRHIADSSDSLKRNRGRRGLDILNKIQKELNIDVQIYEKDFKDIKEVDSKLLKLAQVLNGKVITNDYNLNKVAEFQGVPVLNINELANAVKPVVLPGEEMKIQIVKDGKESGQGIAYLDDGTMIVVEGGRKHIGDVLDVLVTSVLQTAAGRMIFAKPKDMAS
ncbi:MAG: PIN/TRAM domain-containing protein [Clostridiaceae bacterium]